MLSPVAQIGLPGTQELFILLLVLFFFMIAAGIAVLVVVFLLRRNSGNDDRVRELEREVEELREETRDGDGGT